MPDKQIGPGVLARLGARGNEAQHSPAPVTPACSGGADGDSGRDGHVLAGSGRPRAPRMEVGRTGPGGGRG